MLMTLQKFHLSLTLMKDYEPVELSAQASAHGKELTTRKAEVIHRFLKLYLKIGAPRGNIGATSWKDKRPIFE
jgi:hypothetical protein